MALKIMSFIFVISLAFGFPSPNRDKDVPFDVNEVINQVSHSQALPPNPCPLTTELTGEFLIDTNVVYTPAPYDQSAPSIAFDGTNYLVVWGDDRGGSYDIWGTRVSTTGIILDSAGFAISTADYEQWSPSVAFDGTNYLVVWQDRRNSYYYDIYGTRVNQAGVVLDPTGIPISTAADGQEDPSVSFDGTNYLVVWQDSRSGSYDIYGARVNQAGQVLNPTGIPISTAADGQEYPSVAFDGTNYLVVWEDYRNDPDFSDIYGSRVNQAGTVLDPAGIPISTAAYEQYSPSIAFDGTNYLVVWETGIIYGARVNQAGQVLDPAGIPISTAGGTFPSIAFEGENYLVVWEDYRNPLPLRPDIYGARVSQAGIVLDPTGIPISTAVNDQWYPSIAFDGENYLVVWEEWYYGSSDIYGARVNQTGIVLDPAGLHISTVANWQWLPSVAFDGSNYLVVWADYRSGPYPDIYGARINQRGIVLDPAGIPISIGVYFQFSPSVGFDGTNYLVVWEDLDSYTVQSDIYGARVNQAGIVLDPTGIPISTAAYSQYSPSVAFDGSNYLVVWEDGRSLYSLDIYGARVSSAGVVLDPNGIAISTAANVQYSPSVAFDGTNYLVVWTDYRSDIDIYGARVNQAGQILDISGIPISTADGGQGSPSVAFDGTNYLVVWQDSRSGSSNDIYGAKVNQAGTVIDSFAVSLQFGNQCAPKVAKGAGNQMLITYSGWTGEYRGRAYNTTRIWGKFSSDIGIEEENSKLKMQSAKLLEIYPNPAKSMMRVRYPCSAEEQTDIKIFDVSGKLVKEEKVKSAHSHKQEMKISLKGISQGIYFLRLGKETKKFIVTR